MPDIFKEGSLSRACNESTIEEDMFVHGHVCSFFLFFFFYHHDSLILYCVQKEQNGVFGIRRGQGMQWTIF